MLEPQSQELLDASIEKNLPSVEDISVDEARARLASFLTCPEEEKIAISKVKDYELSNFKIRLYQEEENKPVLIFFHGGGLVLNSIETHDGLCRLIAKNSGFSIISVDYRLAPEYQYPTAILDAKEALEWVKLNYKLLNINPRRIFVGGDSSGAYLALSAALNSDVFLSGLLLYYPVCDYYSENNSYKEFETGYFLTKKQMIYFWNCFLGSTIPDNSLNAFPIKSNLNRLPPSYIISCEYDPLRDEAEEFAKLVPKNNKNFFKRKTGVMHGFIAQYRYLSSGLDEVINSCEWLKSFK